MKQIKIKLFTVMLVTAFIITSFLSIFIPSYGATAFENETLDKQSVEVNKETNNSTPFEDNALELSGKDFVDASNTENDIFESLKIPSDCVFNISSSTQSILNSILSKEDFTINGTVTSYNGL